jgi:hypothetical protein
LSCRALVNTVVGETCVSRREMRLSTLKTAANAGLAGRAVL